MQRLNPGIKKKELFWKFLQNRMAAKNKVVKE